MGEIRTKLKTAASAPESSKKDETKPAEEQKPEAPQEEPQPVKSTVKKEKNGAEDVKDQNTIVSTVVGKVLSQEGNPVAGIEVVAFQGGKRLDDKFTTDERGEFRVPKAWRDTEQWLTVVARDGRERLGWFDFMVHGHADIGQKSKDGSFRLVLLPMSRTVRGRILDETGQPLAQIPIQIRQLNHHVNLDAVHWKYQKLGNEPLLMGAFTDADGRYELKVPAESAAWLETAHPQWVPQNIRVSQDKNELLDTKLVRAATVAGRVTDSRTGTPLAGVTVGARATKTEILQNGGEEAKTDADGKYVIAGLRAGEFTVQIDEAFDHSLTTAAKVLQLKSGEQFTADFSLSVGIRLAGRVLDIDSGEPIADCQVTNSNPAHPSGERMTSSCRLFVSNGASPGLVRT